MEAGDYRAALDSALTIASWDDYCQSAVEFHAQLTGIIKFCRLKIEEQFGESSSASHQKEEMEESITMLAKILMDYRAQDGFRMSSDHIRQWAEQFSLDDRGILLRELTHTYRRSYISRETAERFLQNLISYPRFVGSDPGGFWSSINVLRIQQGGSSQRDLLTMLSQRLREKLGCTLPSKNTIADTHLYLDDGIYSGNRLLFDFKSWLEEHRGRGGDIHVIVLALHSSGKEHALKRINEYQQLYDTSFRFHWWRCYKLEDRVSHMNKSDILWPTQLPRAPEARAYARSLKDHGYPVKLRIPLSPPYQSIFFSSEQGRQALERILLEGGAKTLEICTSFGNFIRPYGFSFQNSLGFGSMIATYRNCPNTSPVALWAGKPWRPLLPRKINAC